MATKQEEQSYSQHPFHSSIAGVTEIGALIRLNVRPDRSYRLLDIGCGDGGLVFDLLHDLPNLTALGIDISSANIDMARRECQAKSDDIRSRVRFETADYLAGEFGEFDFAVSNGVLHLLPSGDEQLAGRLARDLVPGGMAVHALPYECWANTLRISLRRILRHLPGEILEALALPLAKRVYPDWNEEALRQRIVYLKSIPYRLYGPKFINCLRSHNLHVTHEAEMQQSSFAKLNHKVIAMRRPEDPKDPEIISRDTP